ncbi:MAG TPA: hypothetical protein VMU39_19765 [Solirubrobacteraceae bacterium]|nr:hypothetical protein [Solirubrobacteraceae bacterium]
MPVVAVVKRESEQSARSVEEPIIDPPGVDADAIEGARIRSGVTESVEHLDEQLREIPVQPVRQPHGPILKRRTTSV